MTTLHVTTRDGETRSVRGENGATLMQVIRDHGFDDLLALCGGCCSCATCHVYVDEAFLQLLPAVSENEDALLDGAKVRLAGSRLSCQLQLSDELEGLRLTIAPED